MTNPSNILRIIVQDWSGCSAGALDHPQYRSIAIELSDEQMKKINLYKNELISNVFLEPTN